MKAFTRYICVWLLFIVACQPDSAPPTTEAPGKPYLVTTTGMIADGVANITGDTAIVEALMGPGVDPHLYKATQGDLEKLQQADYIFYNGLHLEGKMTNILEKLATQKPVYALSSEIPPSLLRKTGPQTYDPHIWFDVKLWKLAIENTGKKLMEQYPAYASFFRKNLDHYLWRLDTLDTYVKKAIETIPKNQRVLITAHDAFEYFGSAYGIEVRGLQGISTQSDFGLHDITTLVDFIVSRGIKAIFIESSVSPRAIEAVVEGCRKKGHDVVIGGTLYSDAMGEPGTFEGTYIGMVTSNVRTIVKALK